MLLSMAPTAHVYRVEQIVGREKTQKQLMNLGIVPGAEIEMVSEMNGNYIISVKQSRLGISRELAQKIHVTACHSIEEGVVYENHRGLEAR